MKSRILVWDVPTRVFHWLLALSFAGAWITAESERHRDVHVMLGYTLLGLIAFRLVWGLVGTRYARFSDFVRSPSAAIRYLKSILSKQPEHHVGHNPAGAIAILLLLVLGIASGISGWMTFNELGGEWLEESHGLLSNLMLAVVGMHIVGVVAGSLIHRENLARAMVTGRKDGEPIEGIRKKRLIPALVLLTLLAGFWGLWFNGKIDLGASGQSAIQQLGGRQAPETR
ncbi:MAG: cytochrome b/b6 domain-containing protein [Thiobacillaceae bacterium]|jgi:cytochrome b